MNLSLWATPERFDHLQEFKKKNVVLSGPLQERVYVGGKEIAVAKYSYNEQRQLTKIQYFKDNAPNGHTALHYENGILKKEATYDMQGTVSEEMQFEYNAKEQLTAYSVKDHKMKQNVLWQFTYQGDKVISGKRLVEKNLTEYFKIENQNEHKSIQQLFDAKGEKDGTVESFFEKGRLIKRVRQSRIGIQEARYHYSSAGVIEKIQFYALQKGELKLVKEHLLVFIDAKGNTGMR